MNAPAALPVAVDHDGRHIVFRTRGRAHGPIVRMVSPSDVGQMIKPFVFLDLIDADSSIGKPGFGWHPHSGIATLTVLMEGRLHYAESNDRAGSLEAGDIEWMSAGRGIWHSGHTEPPLKAFQLWIALPEDRELAPPSSRYLSADDIASDGPARVILGHSGAAHSPIDAPPGINYFDVQLRAGEHWVHTPPQGHQVGWLAVMSGSLHTPEFVSSGELVVFDSSDATIDIVAETDTRFVLGTAIPHPHKLHLGPYSVHTSEAALTQGSNEITRLGGALRAQGVIG